MKTIDEFVWHLASTAADDTASTVKARDYKSATPYSTA